MKNKTVKKIIIAAIAVGVIAGGIYLFWWFHPTFMDYNDRYILGNTEENIVKVYGEPDRRHIEEGKLKSISYAIREQYESTILDELIFGFSYHDEIFYYIEFDENGIATEVELVDINMS